MTRISMLLRFSEALLGCWYVDNDLVFMRFLGHFT